MIKIKILFITAIVVLFIAFCAILLFSYIRHDTTPMTLMNLGTIDYERQRAGYICRPYPPDQNWTECSRFEEVWQYLQNETVQKIALCDYGLDRNNIYPDNWYCWGEIIDPNRINITLQLTRDAKKGNNTSVIVNGRMKIITDKHKFLIPVFWTDQFVCGIEWRSYELRKELWKWGFPPHSEYKYELPPKYETIAILLYDRPEFSPPPLALFGNKKTAEILLEGKIDIIKYGGEKRKENEIIISTNELKPKKIFEGRDWLEKIMDAYDVALKEAEEREKYFPMRLDSPVGKIVFMTREKDYWKEIGIDVNSVYDDYIRSEPLKAYFDELDLTKALLSENFQNLKHTIEPNDSNNMK